MFAGIVYIVGESYNVTKVIITNRAECCSERAVDVRVGVTDTEPVPGVDISPDSYTLCAEKQGKDTYRPDFVP